MFDKLKSLFIEDDGKTEKKKTSEPVKKTTPKEEFVPPVSTPGATSTQGQVSDKFMKILFAAMDNANLDGFDYLEYKQALRNLAKMPMDEQTRFQSAFAMAKTMGATPPKLINAAQHYINVLKSEEKKFGQALVNQRSRQIGDKENAIKQMTGMIAQKQKQIEQLKKEIERDKVKMDKMKNEISGAAAKVEKTKNDFIASYNSIVAQITADMEKMKQYLK